MAAEAGGMETMPRRQVRKTSPRRTDARQPSASSGNWRYWVMLAVIGFLVLVMIVTSLPTQ
jgi:hypothetical protein